MAMVLLLLVVLIVGVPAGRVLRLSQVVFSSASAL
jgi:hypothetical protein